MSETPTPSAGEPAGFGEVHLGPTGSVIDVRMPPAGTVNLTHGAACEVCGNPMGTLYVSHLNPDGSQRLIHIQCPGPPEEEEAP